MSGLVRTSSVMATTYTLADSDGWALFWQGMFIDAGSVVNVIVATGRGTLRGRVPTAFEWSRHKRSKPWIGRRYEMPATQRRRMQRELRHV